MSGLFLGVNNIVPPLNKIVFAWGPEKCVLACAPSQCDGVNLPSELMGVVDIDLVQAIHVAAFGSGESYVVAFSDDDNEIRLEWSGIPKRLDKWLKQRTLVPEVSIGPDDSYIAWDGNKFSWQNLPNELEELLQDWLTTRGWDVNCPRWVSLGMNGSYFVISKSDLCNFNGIGENYPSLRKWIDEALEGIYTLKEVCGTIHSVRLHPFESDVWVVTLRSGSVVHPRRGHPGVQPELRAAAASLSNPNLGRRLRQAYMAVREVNDYRDNLQQEDDSRARLAQMRQQWRAEDLSRLLQEQNESRAQGGGHPAEQESDEELYAHVDTNEDHYKEWMARCEYAKNNIQTLEAFPHLPRDACFCDKIACRTEKRKDGGFAACVHDVEVLLRCDDDYSAAWVKKNRNMWHPDKWTQTLPEVRDDFMKQANHFFTIYTQLMEGLE